MKKVIQIDCDRIGGPDPAYWAARMIYAIRKGDETTAEKCRSELRQRGFDLQQTEAAQKQMVRR